MRMFAALGALISVNATVALAAPITVNNPSFETLPTSGLPFGCGTGCSYSEGPIPGWINGGQFIPGTQVGNFTYFDTIPDGITVAYSIDATISQTVGATVQAGATYTLQVDLGWRNDLSAFSSAADLLVNGKQYFATGATPMQGNWSNFTATYTGLAVDVGDPITIQLDGGGDQGDFDNVRLSDNLASVPAPALGSGPATWALFGGALALFYLRRLVFTRRARAGSVAPAL